MSLQQRSTYQPSPPQRCGGLQEPETSGGQDAATHLEQAQVGYDEKDKKAKPKHRAKV
jgi:hypothetical protein